MATGGLIKRMVVGIDGSDEAAHALDWAIRLAKEVGSEVVAVFAIAPSVYAAEMAGYAPAMLAPELDDKWRSEIKEEFEKQWAAPLASSGLKYRTVLEDGRPASVIADTAERENADLVVVGRRGRGGVAELILGSVSHELTLQSKRPVLLISHPH